MPTAQDIIDLLHSPLFAPTVVIVLAVGFIALGRVRAQARRRLKSANEIEGRLRD
jgi:Flp pilus assembly protein TadB